MREGWKNLAFLLIVTALSLGLGACASDDPAPMEMMMGPPPPPPPPRAPMADPSNAAQIAVALAEYTIEPLLGAGEITKNDCCPIIPATGRVDGVNYDTHDLSIDGGVAQADRGGKLEAGDSRHTPFTMGDAPSAISGFQGSTWSRVKSVEPDVQDDTTLQESDLVVVYTNKNGGTDYLDFGYWLIEFYDDGHHHFLHTFAKGTVDSGNVVPVLGTATYEGGATGLYVTKGKDGNPNASGHFTASTELFADFDADTISGSISDFKTSDGDDIGPKWAVPLGIAQIGDMGRMAGSTTGGGSWKAQFYGPGANNDAPDSVAGTFDAHLWNGHVGGAFGATKQ